MGRPTGRTRLHRLRPEGTMDTRYATEEPATQTPAGQGHGTGPATEAETGTTREGLTTHTAAFATKAATATDAERRRISDETTHRWRATPGHQGPDETLETEEPNGTAEAGRRRRRLDMTREPLPAEQREKIQE